MRGDHVDYRLVVSVQREFYPFGKIFGYWLSLSLIYSRSGTNCFQVRRGESGKKGLLADNHYKKLSKYDIIL